MIRFAFLTIPIALMCVGPVQANEYDLAILDGLVVDGTGSAPQQADVLIRDGTIVFVGDAGSEAPDAVRVIDAKGHIITPGFIDTHAHGNPLVDEAFDNFLLQGFTTVVLGQDGVSPQDERVTYTDLIGLDDWRRAWVGGAVEFDGPVTLDQWLDTVQARGSEVNIAVLSGQGTNRLLVGAGTEDVLDVAQQLAAEEILRADLASGAFGISSGLEYVPGRYASEDELVRLADIVADADGVVMSHLRSEDDDKIEQAIAELLAQGQKARVHIAHMKIVYGKTENQAEAVLAQIAKAQEAGIAVSADVYPYYAGFANMVLVYPSWVKREDQWNAAVADRRDELEKALRDRVVKRNGPEAILIATGEFAGMTLKDVAANLEQPFEKVLIDVFGYGGPAAAHSVMGKAVQDRFIVDENVALSTDGGPWIKHPRSWGSASEVLGHFVRDAGLLPLEMAINKLTAMPARIMAIKDRGIIATGMKADINIIDLEKIKTRATWTEPAQAPDGMKFVIVNGTIAAEDGKKTDGLFGQVLRKGAQ